jgi:glutathione S-transferase
MLELYQYEDCPFCARVRQALDALGLDYVVRTEPRAHPRRERVKRVSGQTQVPVLVDPDRKEVVVESEEIVEYLGHHYGRKET